MVAQLGSEHHEVVVSRARHRRGVSRRLSITPSVRSCGRRPRRCSCSHSLVRAHGVKVVLTGEGADEMFAGYDLFREGKVRRFWGRQPASTRRARLLERLYPYLTRSPVAQQAMARQFFGRNLSGTRAPGFAHDTALAHYERPQATVLAPTCAPGAGLRRSREFLAGLPAEFAQWTPLAQDQYIEIHTLLSGYLLSSQGDRMLMAHSVEGRFPFLDDDVIALANSLPPAYKLRVLDEKHVLKRVATALVPAEIIAAPQATVPRARRALFRRCRRARLCRRIAFRNVDPRGKHLRSGRSRSLLGKCRAHAAAGGAVLKLRQHGAGRRDIDPAPASTIR